MYHVWHIPCTDERSGLDTSRDSAGLAGAGCGERRVLDGRGEEGIVSAGSSLGGDGMLSHIASHRVATRLRGWFVYERV